MKRNNFRILFIFAVAIILTACSSKEIPMENLALSVSNEALETPVNMIVGDKLIIDITIPELEYTTSGLAFADVVTASLSDRQIVLNAISVGTGDVIFSIEAKKHKPLLVTIPVVVTMPTLDVSVANSVSTQSNNTEPPVFEDMELKLAVNQNAQLDLIAPTGTTYTIKTNNDEIATASLNVNTISLTGKTEGTYKLSLEATNPDYQTETVEIDVAVTLTPTVLAAMTDVGVEMGSSSTVKLNSSTKNAKFSATSDNENVSLKVNGTNLTVTSKAVGTSVITVEAAAEGFATTSKTFVATVLPSAVKLDLSQAQLNLDVGKTAKITTATNPKDATRSLRYNETALNVAQSGTTLEITANTVGAYEISITASSENYTDTTKTIVVNVVKPTIQVTTSVKSITTGLGEQPSVKVNIPVDGVNVVVAIDKKIANVTYADGLLSVVPTATGSGNITLTASKDGYETNTITLPIKVAEKATIDKTQKAILDLVNKERNNDGLASLRYNASAQKAADTRAKEIVELFSHTRPDGSNCFTALDETSVKYRAAGENLASGYTDANDVMQGWMSSPGHKENIMRASFTDIAIGVYESGGVYYWTQFFLTT